jgi:hypothetical protein
MEGETIMSNSRQDSSTPTTELPNNHTDGNSRNTDVIELTPGELWHEYGRFAYLDEDGRYHLSGIKESAGIGSRDTHVDLVQLKALHEATGRIIDGLDRPASHGSAMQLVADAAGWKVADLATTAGVDTNALQRHFDGEGPLSQIAYRRVLGAMAGVQPATA